MIIIVNAIVTEQSLTLYTKSPTLSNIQSLHNNTKHDFLGQVMLHLSFKHRITPHFTQLPETFVFLQYIHYGS